MDKLLDSANGSVPKYKNGKIYFNLIHPTAFQDTHCDRVIELGDADTFEELLDKAPSMCGAPEGHYSIISWDGGMRLPIEAHYDGFVYFTIENMRDVILASEKVKANLVSIYADILLKGGICSCNGYLYELFIKGMRHAYLRLGQTHYVPTVENTYMLQLNEYAQMNCDDYFESLCKAREAVQADTLELQLIYNLKYYGAKNIGAFMYKLAYLYGQLTGKDFTSHLEQPTLAEGYMDVNITALTDKTYRLSITLYDNDKQFLDQPFWFTVAIK